MYKRAVLLLLVVAVHLTLGLYTSGDEVVELTAANFNDKVIQSKSLWLVEFYAPWCGHCKNLAPEWVKVAKALKGVAKVGAVNMDAEQSVGAPYGIKGFPTIKIFGANKQSPSDYNGGRTAQAIVDDAVSQLRSMVNSRLGGGSGGRSSGGGSGGDSKDVVELTDSNFDSLVLNSNDIWLVEFFAPWCGHCKNLAPEWARAATELKGKVKLGALDATVHQQVAGRYSIRGYPTIKYFGPSLSEKQSPADYDGGRTSSDIVAWANGKAAENAPAPELIELTNHSRLEEACENKPICLIAFMPQLFDCQSKCRNEYLGLMTKMGDKYKRNQWSWLWTEAGKHVELETALSVGGFGFPALAAVNSRKGKYVLLKGSFSETGINEFLRELSMGRGQTQPLSNSKLPTLNEVAEWDGKDAKIEVEEDINLDDISLDDDVGGFQFRKKTVVEEL